MARQEQEEIQLDYFCNSLNDEGMQKCLLARQPVDIRTAVIVGNEYRRIHRPSHSLKQLNAQEEDEQDRSERPTEEDRSVAETEKVAPVQLPCSMADLLKAIQHLADGMRELRGAVGQTRQSRPRNPNFKDPRTTGCWTCGRMDHLRAACPNKPTESTQQPQKSENSAGQQ